MLISGALLGQPVDFTAPHVAKCADGVYGENWCTGWCNTDGKWGCGKPKDPNTRVGGADGPPFQCDCAGCRGCGGSLKWVKLSDLKWDEFDFLTHNDAAGKSIPTLFDCEGPEWNCTIENQLCHQKTHDSFGDPIISVYDQGYVCQNVDAACWKSEDYKDGGCRSDPFAINVNHAKADASSPDCKWKTVSAEGDGWSACVGGSQSRTVTAKPASDGGAACDPSVIEGTNDGIPWKTETQSC
jgi:hypothetical protein